MEDQNPSAERSGRLGLRPQPQLAEGEERLERTEYLRGRRVTHAAVVSEGAPQLPQAVARPAGQASLDEQTLVRREDDAGRVIGPEEGHRRHAERRPGMGQPGVEPHGGSAQVKLCQGLVDGIADLN